MAKELILILGGARSGKSAYAQQLALTRGGSSVLYVATAEAWDDEMRARITAHRADRPPGWQTLEAPRQVGQQLAAVATPCAVVLVDCLTLLTSNVILAAGDAVDAVTAEAAVANEIAALLAAFRSSTATWVLVSNEVGLGLVPPYPLGRVYRDALGRANQQLAAVADQVLFMVAGLPLRVK